MQPPPEGRGRVEAFLGATRWTARWFYALMVAFAIGCGVATVVQLRDTGLDSWPDVVAGVAVGLAGYVVVLRWGLPGDGRSRQTANRVQMLAARQCCCSPSVCAPISATLSGACTRNDP
jgi:hypothetical protein